MTAAITIPAKCSNMSLTLTSKGNVIAMLTQLLAIHPTESVTHDGMMRKSSLGYESAGDIHT
ncbi:hypothetical protein PY479_10885 [Shewanella sp. A32]|uniref:hypothetical protein n=1 Tax=Shewanella sp. A32 TaxID=3031327 RepID=UPI0023BA344D|nr:hypothetical protein [Shewanella sp. A32]MDF0534776.1 hypothetical protein [Shewanella sp. A32]